MPHRIFRPVGVRGFPVGASGGEAVALAALTLAFAETNSAFGMCVQKKELLNFVCPLLSLSEAAEVSALIASLESKLQEGEDFAFFHSIKWTHKCHIPNMSVLPLGTNYSRMTSTAPSGGGYFLSPKMPRCLH